MSWFIRTSDRDRLFAAAPHQLFRIRFFGRILRVNKRNSSGYSYIEYLTKEQEQDEWETYLKTTGLVEIKH